jgi:TPR repeat protein
LFELLSKGEIGEPLGVPKHEAARHYLRLATRVNYIPAMLRLSEIYMSGFGMEAPDLMEAVRYLKMAADTGDAGSQFRFSGMLRNGEIVKKNVHLGCEYLKKAADGKWLNAQLEMVAILKEAGDEGYISYLEGAAENGDLGSLREVIRNLREKGDTHHIKKWLTLAADKGGDEEKKALADFLSELAAKAERGSREEKEAKVVTESDQCTHETEIVGETEVMEKAEGTVTGAIEEEEDGNGAEAEIVETVV